MKQVKNNPKSFDFKAVILNRKVNKNLLQGLIQEVFNK